MFSGGRIPAILPRPFNRPPADAGIRPGQETIDLVRTQVNALLAQTPSYHQLPASGRERLKERLVHVAAYAAELVRDDWCQSSRLGQTPLVRTRHIMTPSRDVAATTLAAADDFQPAAASQIGRVTEETLRAIAFPTFVADLIKSSFQAIVNSTIQQMEAFTDMLENVSKTVDEFMQDNISTDQARGWLAQRYPTLLQIRQGRADRPQLEVADNADQQALPDFRRELNTPQRIDSLDEDLAEEVLVPAARRKLAQSRLQMLSTMVMLGLQRIVVKHGRIKATMGFHIDTTDRARAEEASLLDTSVAAKASAWYMGFSASVATSVTYVRSTKAESDAEINVNADLTGEIDITFETDYLPLNRFASSEKIESIRANTPNPVANQPSAQTGATPPPARREPGSSASDMIRTHLEHRTAPSAPDLPELPSHQERERIRREREQQGTGEGDGKRQQTRADTQTESPASESGETAGEAEPAASVTGEGGEAADSAAEGGATTQSANLQQRVAATPTAAGIT